MKQQLSLKKRLSGLISTLQRGFIERDTAVRLALLSLLSGEHLLLIGAPGTAKSELARRLHLAINEGDYFERLLTKFSVPEELFGPLSIKSLEEDRYHRLTKNYLPSATIAFIDEIFKANSAILNSLLTLLNEREFDNGDQRVKVPLLCVVGASNELPEEDELAALYDRFLCRYEVMPVSDEQFLALLSLSEQEKLSEPEQSSYESSLKLHLTELDDIAQYAVDVTLPEEVLNLLQSLRSFLFSQNIRVSDRRWRKIIKLLQVAAYTNGQDNVSVWDCFLLQYCLWHKPKQKTIIDQWYQSHLGIVSGFNQDRLEKLVATWESTLSDEQSQKVPVKNQLGELLYKNIRGEQSNNEEELAPLERDGQILYLAPPDNEDRSNNDQGYTFLELREQFFDDFYQQCHINGHWQHIDKYTAQSGNRLNKILKNKPLYEAAHYTQAFIDKRVNETHALYTDLTQFSQALTEQASSLATVLAEHLWVTAEFIEQAEQSLAKTKAVADSLLVRIEQVSNGFKRLPVEQANPVSPTTSLLST